MYIARILYPVKVLGPGNRIGIWFDGCEHHCNNCSNPELWDFNDKYKVNKQQIIRMIRQIADEHHVDGFTLTGGDPFYQPDALQELLPELEKISDDILVYTGYLLEDVRDRYKELLKYIAVLIDGPYLDERNDGCILRGSDNQRIIINKNKFKALYNDYLATRTNEIQNFSLRDGVISVGIHQRGFEKELHKAILLEGE